MPFLQNFEIKMQERMQQKLLFIIQQFSLYKSKYSLKEKAKQEQRKKIRLRDPQNITPEMQKILQNQNLQQEEKQKMIDELQGPLIAEYNKSIREMTELLRNKKQVLAIQSHSENYLQNVLEELEEKQIVDKNQFEEDQEEIERRDNIKYLLNYKQSTQIVNKVTNELKSNFTQNFNEKIVSLVAKTTGLKPQNITYSEKEIQTEDNYMNQELDENELNKSTQLQKHSYSYQQLVPKFESLQQQFEQLQKQHDKNILDMKSIFQDKLQLERDIQFHKKQYENVVLEKQKVRKQLAKLKSSNNYSNTGESQDNSMIKSQNLSQNNIDDQQSQVSDIKELNQQKSESLLKSISNQEQQQYQEEDKNDIDIENLNQDELKQQFKYFQEQNKILKQQLQQLQITNEKNSTNQQLNTEENQKEQDNYKILELLNEKERLISINTELQQKYVDYEKNQVQQNQQIQQKMEEISQKEQQIQQQKQYMEAKMQIIQEKSKKVSHIQKLEQQQQDKIDQKNQQIKLQEKELINKQTEIKEINDLIQTFEQNTSPLIYTEKDKQQNEEIKQLEIQKESLLQQQSMMIENLENAQREKNVLQAKYQLDQYEKKSLDSINLIKSSKNQIDNQNNLNDVNQYLSFQNNNNNNDIENQKTQELIPSIEEEKVFKIVKQMPIERQNKIDLIEAIQNLLYCHGQKSLKIKQLLDNFDSNSNIQKKNINEEFTFNNNNNNICNNLQSKNDQINQQKSLQQQKYEELLQQLNSTNQIYQNTDLLIQKQQQKIKQSVRKSVLDNMTQKKKDIQEKRIKQQQLKEQQKLLQIHSNQYRKRQTDKLDIYQQQLVEYINNPEVNSPEQSPNKRSLISYKNMDQQKKQNRSFDNNSYNLQQEQQNYIHNQEIFIKLLEKQTNNQQLSKLEQQTYLETYQNMIQSQQNMGNTEFAENMKNILNQGKINDINIMNNEDLNGLSTQKQIQYQQQQKLKMLKQQIQNNNQNQLKKNSKDLKQMKNNQEKYLDNKQKKPEFLQGFSQSPTLNHKQQKKSIKYSVNNNNYYQNYNSGNYNNTSNHNQSSFQANSTNDISPYKQKRSTSQNQFQKSLNLKEQNKNQINVNCNNSNQSQEIESQVNKYDNLTQQNFKNLNQKKYRKSLDQKNETIQYFNLSGKKMNFPPVDDIQQFQNSKTKFQKIYSNNLNNLPEPISSVQEDQRIYKSAMIKKDLRIQQQQELSDNQHVEVNKNLKTVQIDKQEKNLPFDSFQQIYKNIKVLQGQKEKNENQQGNYKKYMDQLLNDTIQSNQQNITKDNFNNKSLQRFNRSQSQHVEKNIQQQQQKQQYQQQQQQQQQQYQQQQQQLQQQNQENKLINQQEIESQFEHAKNISNQLQKAFQLPKIKQ